MKKYLRRTLKKAFWHVHKFFLHLGLIVLPNHYYSSVPDVNELARTRPLWARQSSLVGLSLDPDEEASCLASICC